MKALSMVRGSKGKSYTYYSCGVVESALEKGCRILVAKKGRTVGVKPLLKHRPNLFDTFGPSHELAEQGKYIDSRAISGNRVCGAQNVNPFIDEEGSYNTIIAAFYSLFKNSILNDLSAAVSKNRVDGHHLRWRGSRRQNGAVVVSDWVTASELWDIAKNINPRIVSILNANKSQRDDVEQHLNAKTKFEQNLNVLRRTRRTMRIATGEIEYGPAGCGAGEIEEGGGATPYAMPLEQCDMAIDMACLTVGYENGEEIGDYCYRLAIGRPISQVFYVRDWQASDKSCPEAYKNESIRRRAK